MKVHAYCGCSHFLKSGGLVSSLQLQSCLILSLTRPLFSYLWLITSPLRVKYVSVYYHFKVLFNYTLQWNNQKRCLKERLEIDAVEVSRVAFGHPFCSLLRRFIKWIYCKYPLVAFRYQRSTLSILRRPAAAVYTDHCSQNLFQTWFPRSKWGSFGVFLKSSFSIYLSST